MAFCRFCGKELVNGQCDCYEFQASIGNIGEYKKMEFCRFCGKELVNGQCNCYEFQASIANVAGCAGTSSRYQQPYQQSKDPFLVQSFKLNFSSVSSFLSSIRDQSGMSEPDLDTNDPYEHNVPIVPDCVQAEDNEIVVKQYNIARLRTRLKLMKAEGRMMVTNRRVLFRASGTSLTGNILQEHQFNLDEIAGIEMHKDYKFSLLSFFGCNLLMGLASFLTYMIFSSTSSGGAIAVSIILGILGLIPTFIVYKHFWVKLLCAIVGYEIFFVGMTVSENIIFLILLIVADIIVLIDLIIVCFVPNLVIKIKTKGATGAIVICSKKAMSRKKTGDYYSDFAEVMPWDDTIMAMNELGTMINDLQKLGDYAIEKWSR